LCSHLEQYYFNVVEEQRPFAFWIFDTDHLETVVGREVFHLEHVRSSTGDDCHVDVVDLSNEQAKNYFKEYFKPPNVYICGGDRAIQLTQDQFQNFGAILQETSA